MNYKRFGRPQSTRTIVEREFPIIDVASGVKINSIKGVWHAQLGYYCYFKILIDTPYGQLNLCGCRLQTNPGGVLLWKTPNLGTMRAVELDKDFYALILKAFERQSWISFIGSSKMVSDSLPLPPDDPLARALALATATI
jgi:hypothetical protein